MSNTYKHKGQGYFKRGIKNKKEVAAYLKYCDRHNSDYSYDKAILTEKQQKQADLDMRQQINDLDEDNDYIN